MREPSPYFIRRGALPEPELSSTYFEDEIAKLDVWSYWRVVRKRLGLICAITAATLLLTLLHLLMAKPIYTAKTTVMILPRATTGIDPAQALLEIEASYDGSDYLKTQTQILKSRTLAAQVVRDLGLARNPSFVGSGEPGLFDTVMGNLRKMLHDLVASAPAGRRPPPQGLMGVDPGLIGAYLGGLAILHIKDTSLVDIDYSSPDPTLAARIANAHALAYIQRGIQLHSEASRAAEKFLDQKLIELKEQLEHSEIALNDYRRKKGIIPGLMSLDGKDAVVIDRLADLSKDMTKAEVQRIGLESQVEIIRKHQYDSLPQVMNDKLVQQMETQLNQLYAKDASLSNQFTPAYPPLAQIRAQEAALKTRLNQEIQASVDQIQAAYNQSVEQEHELDEEMQKQRSETLKLNDAAVQYAILQRDVDTNRQLYNAVLTRMKDVGVEAEAQTSNVSIVDKATPPLVPTSPRKVHDLMAAGVLGLCGALGLVFLLDYLDNTLRDPEEAERYLRLPNIGIIPEFKAINSSAYGVKSYAPVAAILDATAIGNGNGSKALANGRNAAVPELVTAHGPYSQLGEAYRNLRTALLLSRAGAPPKVTLITSAVMGEGKTVTAVNCAAILAQLGARVLLIDADLRRPRCHRVLAVENHLGLTEVLTGVRDLHDLIRPSGVENLFLLSSGSVPPNASELLGSSKMHEVLTELQEIYDYVVIDSPPVMPVSDALLLSTLADGVLLVANASHTPRHQVRAARARLEYARAKIFGTVLNRVKLHHSEYHYYHQGYYYSPEDEQAVYEGHEAG